MRTPLANFLISEGAPQDFAEHGWVTKCFEGLIQTIHQGVEELKGIMLFSKVNWLSP